MLTFLRIVTGTALLLSIIFTDTLPLYLSAPRWMQIYLSIVIAFGILEIPRGLLILGDFADWHFSQWAQEIAKFINHIFGKEL